MTSRLDQGQPGQATVWVVAACAALNWSCGPTLPARSSAAEPSAKPTAAETQPRPTSPETPRPTIAERAARYDAMVQNQPAQAPATAGGLALPGPEYGSGYPRFNPAPKARADGSLQSFLLLDTGPYPANHSDHILSWTNDSGRRLSIYKAYVWTGVDKGAVADVHIEARRASDNSYIAILQWDHYADPTVPQHAQQFDYPSPMTIDPGDAITIRHYANGFAPGWRAHHMLILWIK